MTASVHAHKVSVPLCGVLAGMMTTATGLLVNDAVYDFDLVDDIRSSNSK